MCNCQGEGSLQKGVPTDMPRVKKDTASDTNLLDQLIREAYAKRDPKETILSENGLLRQLTKRVVEQCLNVRDIFIACVDGLTGMSEAIQSAFPKHGLSVASFTWSEIRSNMCPGRTTRL